MLKGIKNVEYSIANPDRDITTDTELNDDNNFHYIFNGERCVASEHAFEDSCIQTKVISAFPGCGKTTYYKSKSKYSQSNNLDESHSGYQIIDSDSSLFSWIYDENGNKTDCRNPNFVNDYINHIRKNLGKEQIIFVSSHKEVREALKREHIPYTLIYPDKSLKNEWMLRFKNRGNNKNFIEFQYDHWDEFIDDMDNETYPTKIKISNIHDNCFDKYVDSLLMNDAIPEFKSSNM